jgi:hypothetical protein
VGQEPRHLTLRTTMRQRITRGVPSCCSSGTRPVHRSALRLHGARQRRRPRELGAGPDHDRPRADILRGGGGPDSVGTGPAPTAWTPRKEATTSRRRWQRSGLGAPRPTCCTVTPPETDLYGQVADDLLAGVLGGTDSMAAGGTISSLAATSATPRSPTGGGALADAEPNEVFGGRGDDLLVGGPGQDRAQTGWRNGRVDHVRSTEVLVAGCAPSE